MKTKPAHSLGEKLRFYRTRLHLSQFELETLTDMARGSIAKIETGQNEPKNQTLVRLTRALKLNKEETMYLLGIDVYAYAFPEGEHKYC